MRCSRGRIVALAVALVFGAHAAEASQIYVVTTMSTYADIVSSIGGEHVEVNHIAPPRFNPHFIEPRPSDVLKVKRADLFVHGGLDLEAWRDPLVNTAGNPKVRPGGPRDLPVSKGVRLLDVPETLSRSQGDIHIHGNPHFWSDPRNGAIIANNIASRLSALDAAHADDYAENLERFQEALERKMIEWREILSPFRGREVAAYHDQWPYILEFAGIAARIFIEPKPGIPPGPRHLAEVEKRIREDGVPAIVQATYFPDRAAKRIAAVTGARIVKLCQNVGEVDEATSYIAMVDYNIRKLAGGLPVGASRPGGGWCRNSYSSWPHPSWRA